MGDTVFLYDSPNKERSCIGSCRSLFNTDSLLPVALHLSSMPVRQSRACQNLVEINRSDI